LRAAPRAQRRVDFDQRLLIRSVDADLFDDADDLVRRRTVVADVLADGVAVGQNFRARLSLTKRTGLPSASSSGGKGAATQDRDAHRSEIIAADNRPIDINQLAALGSG
jgi:hypothetical protein